MRIDSVSRSMALELRRGCAEKRERGVWMNTPAHIRAVRRRIPACAMTAVPN
jgi:hypothetical protein